LSGTCIHQLRLSILIRAVKISKLISERSDLTLKSTFPILNGAHNFFEQDYFFGWIPETFLTHLSS
jgi:hypothetical protein